MHIKFQISMYSFLGGIETVDCACLSRNDSGLFWYQLCTHSSVLKSPSLLVAGLYRKRTLRFLETSSRFLPGKLYQKLSCILNNVQHISKCLLNVKFSCDVSFFCSFVDSSSGLTTTFRGISSELYRFKSSEEKIFQIYIKVSKVKTYLSLLCSYHFLPLGSRFLCSFPLLKLRKR